MADDQPRRQRQRDPRHVRNRMIEHFEDAHVDLNVRAIVLTAAGEALLHRRRPVGARNPCRRSPKAHPSGSSATAPVIRRGIQRLIGAVPRLREADHRRAQRHCGRRRRDGALASDLVIAADNAKHHPGLRAPRPHPRRRRHLPAAPARRTAQGQGARVLRRRPLRGRRGAHRPREQGGARRRAGDDREEWAERLARDRPRRSARPRSCSTRPLDATATTLEEEAMLVELNTTTDSAEGMTASASAAARVQGLVVRTQRRTSRRRPRGAREPCCGENWAPT